MTTENLNIILDAFDKLEKHVTDSFDQFKKELSEQVDTIHPQDIADKEISDLESEADYINQIDEDNYREAYQEHHQK